MDQTTALLAALWRGGNHGYYWSSSGKKSQWMSARDIQACALGQTNVYFGVHPTCARRSPYERSRISDVAAVNCLFAEFDAKDESYGSLESIREHIKALDIQPQVIVASGGGYHAYWILSEPIIVSDAVRDYLRGIQAAWVKLVGGDTGAKDLARVLRVPGTLNAKYTPARKVEFARFRLDGSSLWDVNALCALAEPLYEDQGDLPVADLPDVEDGRPVATGAIPGIINVVATAVEGERDSKLLWAACRLVEHGMSEPAITAELMPVARRVGLTEGESRATIHSAMKQPIRNHPPQARSIGGSALPDLHNRRMKMQEALNGSSQGSIS